MPPKRQGSSSASLGIADAFQTLASSYKKSTPARIKLIDAFLLFLVATGVAQFVYCVLISDYPFNSFLAGFAATVGQFVLTLSLRMQTRPVNPNDFARVNPERAFVDFLFASVVLHFFVVNFLG